MKTSAVLFAVATLCTFQTIVGTSRIAAPGRPFSEALATKEYAWPTGAIDLINDDRRTVGWWSWFSGCPNDVMHFAFALRERDDLARLLTKFQAMKVYKLPIITLPAADERAKVGAEAGSRKANGMRVILVPAGAGKPGVKSEEPAAAILALSSQVMIDKWYATLPVEEENGRQVRVFGQTRYAEVPRAMPPTLRIYVEHPHVDLTRLDLDVEIELSAEISEAEAERRGDDDNTLRAIRRAIDAHAAKKKKAADEQPADVRTPLRP